MRLSGLSRSALGATFLYVLATVALTWPLVPRAARDVPGDLLDPLFTCWALGWNFHAFGLSAEGAQPTSYWDANIFYPTPQSLVRSEHFLPQAVQGALVYAGTHNLVLTYNLLFLSTFVLSGTFLYLLAREETGDPWAALAAGLFYAFALYRWAQVPHLGALSSQWMPLALLLVRRVARVATPPSALWAVLALAMVTAVQVLSSGYYLLFFPPFLVVWALVEARRAGGAGPLLRLAGAGALAAAIAVPIVLPYIALRRSGAQRDLTAVVAHSADLLSLMVAPEITRLWGRVLTGFPRGEASLFPGVVTPLLAAVAVVMSARAARSQVGAPWLVGGVPTWLRRMARASAIVLGAAGIGGWLAALRGGLSVHMEPLGVRAVGTRHPLVMVVAALAVSLLGWPRFGPFLRVFLGRREVLAVGLATLAVWLSLGPVPTLRGWPIPLASPYRWLYEHAPGFSAGRAPARFAMIAACFGAVAAAWGFKHLRTVSGGGWAVGLLSAAFLVETAAVPLPLSQQWEIEGVAALPPWLGGRPSPIVAAIRRLPDDAVVAALPMGEIFHETRVMFDSTYHWRRLLNGYSSWPPADYLSHVAALRDPLRRAPEVLAALRAAGVTHIVVREASWLRDKGPRVTERLLSAGAKPIDRVGDVALLSVPR